MKLFDLGPGDGAVVVEITARPDLRTRLIELGLRPGATVTCQQRCAGGGRVVRVGNARVALDRATLEALEIEPIAGHR